MTAPGEAEMRADVAIGQMLRTARRMGATARRASRDLGCNDPVRAMGDALRDVFGTGDERVPADWLQLLEGIYR